MSDRETAGGTITLQDLAQDLGKSESDVLSLLNISELHASVHVNGGTANIVQGSNPKLYTTVVMPPGSTVQVSATKKRASDALVDAAEAYVQGVKALKQPVDHQPGVEDQLEGLAHPVVTALEHAINLNVDATVIAECLVSVGKTLPLLVDQYQFDRVDQILGRGAYLIVFSAFALAVAHERFEMLRVFVQQPIRWFGTDEFPLGGVRAYFFARVQNGSPEREVFYDRLFHQQTGWLTPFLKRRVNPTSNQIELDFIAELAFAYAWRVHWKAAPYMPGSYGKFYSNLPMVKDYIRTHKGHLAQVFPDFKDLLDFIIRSYDGFPTGRKSLGSAFQDVLTEL